MMVTGEWYLLVLILSPLSKPLFSVQLKKGVIEQLGWALGLQPQLIPVFG